MMSLRHALAAAVVLLVLATCTEAAPSIEMSTTDVTVDEGAPFTFVSTVRNADAQTWPEVTVTLNVIRAGDGISEDPEDWDPSWSHRFVVVEPGREIPVEWQIRTIKPGDFLMFVTVVVHGDTADGPWAEPVVSGDIVRVHVDAKPVVPIGKMAPVAVGVPLVLAAIAVWRRQATMVGA